MSRLIFAAATVACVFSTSAQAQEAAQENTDKPRVYVSVFAGGLSPDAQTFFGRNEAGMLRDIVVDYDAPITAGVNIGVVAVDKPFGRLRVEGELSYRSARVEALSLNDIDRVVMPGSKSSAATGFVNLWYDTPKILGVVRVSAGAGFGLASIDNNILYLVALPAATNGQARIAIPDSNTTFAYQLMGGVELDVSRSFSIIGDVRHVRFGDYQAQRFILNTPGVLGGNGGTLDSVLESKWAATSITAGIRLKF